MPLRSAGYNRTNEREPRFHGATIDATCSHVDSDGPNAHASRPDANFNAAIANKPLFKDHFVDANADAARVDNTLHVRTTSFQ